ncbi:hypothetical protein AB0L86_16715 [Micromonospora musae]
MSVARSAGPEPVTRPAAGRWLVLAVLCLAPLVVVLDCCSPPAAPPAR